MTELRLVETPEDLDRFRDLIVEYEASLPPELKHADFERDLRDLQRYYGAPNVTLIALVDGAAAGCIALAEHDPSTAIMKKLYVRPDYRNYGIARALCTALINAGRERGYGRIALDTDRERLPAAYKLYLSIGFTLCEPYGAVDHGSPTFMELPLE